MPGETGAWGGAEGVVSTPSAANFDIHLTDPSRSSNVSPSDIENLPVQSRAMRNGAVTPHNKQTMSNGVSSSLKQSKLSFESLSSTEKRQSPESSDEDIPLSTNMKHNHADILSTKQVPHSVSSDDEPMFLPEPSAPPLLKLSASKGQSVSKAAAKSPGAKSTIDKKPNSSEKHPKSSEKPAKKISETVIHLNGKATVKLSHDDSKKESKNHSEKSTEKPSKSLSAEKKKKVGRPPGSLNKPKSPTKTDSNSNVVSTVDLSSDDDDIPLSLLKKPETDMEDLPLSVIKKISPQKKKLKTQAFSPKKSLKQSKAQSVIDKHFKRGPSVSITGSPKSSKSSEYQQPKIVAKILNMMKSAPETPELHKRIQVALNSAARFLSESEREQLPDSLKEQIQTRYLKLLERERLKNLTPEQRAAELKQKLIEKKQEQLRLKTKLANGPEAAKPVMPEKLDELQLKLTPLPVPSEVKLPEGITMDMYGDVVMVIEFLHMLKEMLAPEGFEFDFSVKNLMEALVTEKQGFIYLSSILEMLLRTLLHDENNSYLKDIGGIELSQVAVTIHTVSDLARLYMARIIGDPERGIVLEKTDTLSAAAEKLEGGDFLDLDPNEKISIISFLCHEVLITFSFDDLLRDKEYARSEAFKARLKAGQDYNAYIKEQEQLKDSEKAAAAAAAAAGGSDSGIGSAESEMSPEEIAILTSKMSTRQQEIELGRIRKEKEESEKRKKLDAEYAYNRVCVNREKANSEYDALNHFVMKLTRIDPIGYDRFHNRYWMFRSVKGVLVEKCWASQCIDYEPVFVNTVSERSWMLESEPHPETAGCSVDDPPEKDGNQNWETEFDKNLLPKCGQNTWCVYNTMEQINQLLKSLYDHGNREKALKAELKKQLPTLEEMLKSADPEQPQEPEESNLPVLPRKYQNHYLEYLQQDLKDFLFRLFNGGLARNGIEIEPLECKIDKYTNMKSMRKAVLLAFDAINPKFLTGLMKFEPGTFTSEVGEGFLSQTDESSNELEEDMGALETDPKQCHFPAGVLKWRREVLGTSTWSRLHVLTQLLECCVKWEKSAAKANCLVCRKKKDEDKMLLCDNCNKAYHMFCLRPALKAIPEGDWLCPACKPRDKRRPADARHFSDEDEAAAGAAPSEIVHEDWCFSCCDGGDELIMCSTCPRVFHLPCHEPPLRRIPRGDWVCMVCINPRKKRKAGFLAQHSAYNKKKCSRAARWEESDDAVNSGTETAGSRRSHDDDCSSSGRPTRASNKVIEEVNESESDNTDDDGRRRRPVRSSTRARNNRRGEDADLHRVATLNRTRGARGEGTRGRRRATYAESVSSSEDGGGGGGRRSSSADSSDGEEERRTLKKRNRVKKSHSSSDEDSCSKPAPSKKVKKEAASSDEDQEEDITPTKRAGAVVVDINEEQEICQKIFHTLRQKTQFMFFENVAEVEAYAECDCKVDFRTIEVMMREPRGYVWANFIRDLALIVNNALLVFDESHKVHRAALKMDERMLNLMSNLPIMRDHYQQVRAGNVLIQETHPVSNGHLPPASASAGDDGRFSKCSDEGEMDVEPPSPSTPAANHSANQKKQKQKKSSSASTSSHSAGNRSLPSSPEKPQFKMVEVNEEVDICQKIFYDLKSKSSFMFFENIADVEAYKEVENKVDFSTIDVMFEDPGYIWANFIRDLAIIVNNATSVFEDTHKVYKAALKLDERIINLLVNLPIMRKHYLQTRGGKPECGSTE